MKKNLKHGVAILLLVCFVVLAQGCGTDPAFWAAVGEGINSGITDASTPTYLSGTYYLQLSGYDWSITFSPSGSFTFLIPGRGSSSGTYTISGNRLTTRDTAGAVDVWTIVNSTTISDSDGDRWVK
jgi:hypothetical protein